MATDFLDRLVRCYRAVLEKDEALKYDKAFLPVIAEDTLIEV